MSRTIKDRADLVNLPIEAKPSYRDSSGREVHRTPQEDYSVRGESAELVLRNHAQRCIEMIRKSDTVFGCIAWITHPEILDALAEPLEWSKDERRVQIIVNKEDFLRPDYTDKVSRNETSFYNELKSKYYRLKGGVHTYLEVCRRFVETETGWNAGGIECQALRCVGLSLKQRWSPKMHHKFAVFMRGCGNGLLGYSAWVGRNSYFNEHGEEVVITSGISPNDYRHSVAASLLLRCGKCHEKGCFAAAWIGSFNWTKNAGKSFESVVITEDREIVNSLLWEHSQLLLMSEPLDWNSPYVDPELSDRIGES